MSQKVDAVVVPAPSFSAVTKGYFIAGTVGGWAQVAAGHPFDTLKVRLQTQGDPPKYKSAMDCFKITLKEEGPMGLYKGASSPLMGVGIWFNAPFELLKVKLQTQNLSLASSPNAKPQYSGVFDCGMKVMRERGVTGLYRGVGITLLRDIPSFAAYFGVYEGTKMLLSGNDPKAELGAAQLILAGGMAGIAAWLPCYPQDVIKSRIQSDNRNASVGTYIKEILRSSNGSVRGFFKGFAPTMLRAFPANAATFLAYEMTTKAIDWDSKYGSISPAP
ncbi:hypothetical protein HDV00_009368 [Rhizophlyctis rosea]|nr:hypothetical protein HDV00_009368 [Rhizophlyctis rosea]